MSTTSTAYAIDLSCTENLSGEEREAYVHMAVRDIAREYDEDTARDSEAALRKIFGIGEIPAAELERTFNKPAFEWFGENFGRRLRSTGAVTGIFRLELETKLLRYMPPFGFPQDEHVTYLPVEDVDAELAKFGDADLTAEEEWLAEAREEFIGWLAECSRERRSLLILES